MACKTDLGGQTRDELGNSFSGVACKMCAVGRSPSSWCRTMIPIPSCSTASNASSSVRSSPRWTGSSDFGAVMRSTIQFSALPLSQLRLGRSSMTLRPRVTRRLFRLSMVCTVAVVNRSGESLVFHQDSRDVFEFGAKRGGRAFEQRDGRGGRVILVMRAVRCDGFEAVAAGVPESGYADPGADVGQVAATERPPGRPRPARVVRRRHRGPAWPRQGHRQCQTACRRNRGTPPAAARLSHHRGGHSTPARPAATTCADRPFERQCRPDR